jgi:hypothetical protein
VTKTKKTYKQTKNKTKQKQWKLERTVLDT